MNQQELFSIVSIALLVIGVYTVLSQRNLIRILIGIELMLNAAILNFVRFGVEGQLMALFLIALAAAGAAVALAIVLNVYKQYRSIDPADLDQLKN